MGNKIFTNKIKGITKYYAPGHMHQFHVGDFLRLVPEFDNPFDQNAIAIYDDHNHKLGFVDREINVWIYKLMKSTEYFCLITSVYANPDRPSIEYQLIYRTVEPDFDVSESLFRDYYSRYSNSKNGNKDNKKANDESKSFAETLDGLKNVYEIIKQLVTEVTQNPKILEIAKTYNSETLLCFFMSQIDLALQHMMLVTFFSANKFSVGDMMAIRDLTEYDDIISRFELEYSWEDIQMSLVDKKQFEAVLNSIEPLLQSEGIIDSLTLLLKCGAASVPLFEMTFKTALTTIIAIIAGIDAKDEEEKMKIMRIGFEHIEEKMCGRYTEFRRSKGTLSDGE